MVLRRLLFVHTIGIYYAILWRHGLLSWYKGVGLLGIERARGDRQRHVANAQLARTRLDDRCYPAVPLVRGPRATRSLVAADCLR